MSHKSIPLLYIHLISKPCLGRNLELEDKGDGTITIDKKIYKNVADIEALLSTVKRKDISKHGKKH